MGVDPQQFTSWSELGERLRDLLGGRPEKAAQILALAERLEEQGILEHALVFIDTVVAARQKGKPLFGSPELSLRLLAVFTRLAEQDAAGDGIRVLEAYAAKLKEA